MFDLPAITRTMMMVEDSRCVRGRKGEGNKFLTRVTHTHSRTHEGENRVIEWKTRFQFAHVDEVE